MTTPALDIPPLFHADLRTDGELSWKVVEAEAQRLRSALAATSQDDLAATVEAARKCVMESWPDKCKRRKPHSAIHYLRALDAFHVVRRQAYEVLAGTPRR